MDAAAHLLPHLGRPGEILLGAARTGTPTTTLSTGSLPLDALLGGGLPGGRLSEITGAHGAGRTSLACSIVAAATHTGALVAWIDPDDTLDPESAATAGVLLTHVLWVQPRHRHDALRAADLLLAAGGFALIVLDLLHPDTARGFTRWTRFSRTAERSGTALLLLSPERRLGTSAALALEVTARRTEWSRGEGRQTLLDGVDSHVHVTRARHAPLPAEPFPRRACA